MTVGIRTSAGREPAALPAGEVLEALGVSAEEGLGEAEVSRRLEDIDHALGVLWDLRRRELAGETVGLDEAFLDRYVVSPRDDAPDDYTWAR